jgi:hypothetical protein
LPLISPDADAAPKVYVVAAKKTGKIYEPVMLRTYVLEQRGNTVAKPQKVYECKMWEAGRATSAAPTYFSSLTLDGDELVDGGVALGNNPVKEAIKEAGRIWHGRPIGLLVSLGTGKPPAQVKVDTGSLGSLEETIAVGKRFKNMVLDTEAPHQELCEQVEADSTRYDKLDRGVSVGRQHGGKLNGEGNSTLKGCTYLRLNPPLERTIKMNTTDPKDVADLREAAEKFMQSVTGVRYLTDLAIYVKNELSEGVPPEPNMEPEPELDMEPEPELDMEPEPAPL